MKGRAVYRNIEIAETPSAQGKPMKTLRCPLSLVTLGFLSSSAVCQDFGGQLHAQFDVVREKLGRDAEGIAS